MRWLLLCFVLFAGAPLADDVPHEHAKGIWISPDEHAFLVGKFTEQDEILKKLQQRLLHAANGIRCV